MILKNRNKCLFSYYEGKDIWDHILIKITKKQKDACYLEWNLVVPEQCNKTSKGNWRPKHWKVSMGIITICKESNYIHRKLKRIKILLKKRNNIEVCFSKVEGFSINILKINSFSIQRQNKNYNEKTMLLIISKPKRWNA